MIQFFPGVGASVIPAHVAMILGAATDNTYVYCFQIDFFVWLHVMVIYIDISIYILVELKSYVRKLLTQFVHDCRETRDCYKASHGDCYKGVNRR